MGWFDDPIGQIVGGEASKQFQANTGILGQAYGTGVNVAKKFADRMGNLQNVFGMENGGIDNPFDQGKGAATVPTPNDSAYTERLKAYQGVMATIRGQVSAQALAPGKGLNMTASTVKPLLAANNMDTEADSLLKVKDHARQDQNQINNAPIADRMEGSITDILSTTNIKAKGYYK